MWCWRRILHIPWTAREKNASVEQIVASRSISPWNEKKERIGRISKAREDDAQENGRGERNDGSACQNYARYCLIGLSSEEGLSGRSPDISYDMTETSSKLFIHDTHKKNIMSNVFVPLFHRHKFP